MDSSHVSAEIDILKLKIKELGQKDESGKFSIKFGLLYEQTVDIFEAINGTLRAAKRNKVVDFAGQMLLKGANDNVVITLLQE